MSLLDWFASRKREAPALRSLQDSDGSDGLWSKCPSCSAVSYTKDLLANASVCLKCGHHFRIDSQQRIRLLVDEGSFQPLDGQLRPTDPLGFQDRKAYVDRLRDYQKSTGLSDAVVTGLARLQGLPLALGVMDFRFMGGSMGSVVGEKLTRLLETATRSRYPVVIVCASGGARMQEGLFSLMQMAKVAGALHRHRQARCLYIPLLTDPTTGGVTASFAMLGDLNLAEPRAMIGFAGRRVIEETLREKLPVDFQTAEYLQEHGFVDCIVERTRHRSVLADLFRIHGVQPVVAAAHDVPAPAQEAESPLSASSSF